MPKARRAGSLSLWDRADTSKPSSLNIKDKNNSGFPTVLVLADAIAKPLEAVRILKLVGETGLLFVYGKPEQLPAIAIALESVLTFKYWVAVKTASKGNWGHGHKGLLVFCRKDNFQINKIRISHPKCRACEKTLRDWGGKTHLMHPDGAALSDVWSDIAVDPDESMPSEILNRVSGLAGLSKSNRGLMVTGNAGKNESIRSTNNGFAMRSDAIQQIDKVYQGDCLDMMRSLKSESVDLAFADPPYNLAKNYRVFSDDQSESDYIDWCNAWLTEYVRVLKPGGSLFVLNLPRWANHHFVFLNRLARFRCWIVWDALSEPRGKLMPAHYALLHFVKNGRPPKENANMQSAAPDFCVRATCIGHRKDEINDKEPLGDIRTDIFRLKHKSSRDVHPCQLPEKLMERIIMLSTVAGDVVLDAFCGAGTTAVTAARLGRRYITMDINPDYVSMTIAKLKTLLTGLPEPIITRPLMPRPKPAYSKKELQLDLQRIALKLGRLPVENEIERFSNYPLIAYKTSFPNLSKALKAAKLVT